MDKLTRKIGLTEDRRYYIITNNVFKLLYFDMDMTQHAKLHIPTREMNVYVKVLTELENSEGDDVVFLGEDTKVDDVVGEDVDVAGEDVGVVGKDEGNFGGDVDDSDDLLDSDYDMEEEWGDDDQMFQRNIDPGIELEIYVPEFTIGMQFSTKKEFRRAVQSHAVNARRTLKTTKNVGHRVYVRCVGDDCQWRINVVKVKNEATFRIREYNSNCPQTFHVKNVNTDWLSKKFLKKFKYDPKRNVKGFRQDVIEEINCHVSKDQAYRAKTKALKAIEGSPDYQYTKLWNYADELRRSNPGSTIILGTEDDSEGVRFNLSERSCTCRKWGLSGIPYEHVISAIFDQREVPEDYVDECYSVDTYKIVYAPAIMGINGKQLWGDSMYIPPLPPNFGRGAGRPARARRMEPGETAKKGKKRRRIQEQKLRRQQTTVKCRKCGVEGHNSATCSQGREEAVQDGQSDLSNRTEGQRSAETTNQLVGVENAKGSQRVEHEGDQPMVADTIDIEDMTQSTQTTTNTSPRRGRRPGKESVISDYQTTILPPSRQSENPTILPPSQQSTQEPEADIETNFMTPRGACLYPPPIPPTMPGPTMYQQLQMAIGRFQRQTQPSGIHSRVQTRALPPMTGSTFIPSRSVTTSQQSSDVRSFIVEGGQKYVSISNPAADKTQPPKSRKSITKKPVWRP
ncbi:hypothetical protein BUALT_Bualt19G0038500 [Buddleja alternifolia]|uniref:Zinc finger PMZ-type domain-containing protein n=1 Tax=Buddleja alternifolia TaxID=168488 RepID=A0AAV6W974_9LAMI|nr:hypothetical protein BUALT_Bualt19G0038500 [Buddleja alternifolia]